MPWSTPINLPKTKPHLKLSLTNNYNECGVCGPEDFATKDFLIANIVYIRVKEQNNFCKGIS